MAVHSGLIAARSTVTQLADEMTTIWPKSQIVAKEELDGFESFASWEKANKKFVSARDWRPDNRGVEVYPILQSGPWAVILDSSYVLAGDEEALKALSRKFGAAVSFITETAGGYAGFMSFSDGYLVRRVQNTNGEVASEGMPLQEESGLPMGSYYVSEAEELQRRLGLPAQAGEGQQKLLAVAVVDQTDYSVQVQQIAASDAKAKKSWWRFW